MSDLTRAQWHAIEKASVYLPQEGGQGMGRYIGLGVLRNIIRKSKRSNSQNALIHALFDDAIKAGGEALRGWTAEDIKEWALGEFWGWDEFKALGRTRLKPKRRSSSMTKTECSDFTEWFVAQMAEHHIVLELPGDQEAA
jgi:hypothetical protein